MIQDGASSMPETRGIEIEEAMAEPSTRLHETPAQKSRTSFARVIVPWTAATLLAIALAVSSIGPETG